MSQIIDQEFITNTLYGASLLAGGGGGPLQAGLDMMNKLAETTTIECTMISVNEIPDGTYCAVTAGEGAPSEIQFLDFAPYAQNSFTALQNLAGKLDPPKVISCITALEDGGMNSFVPMFNAITQGFSYVDTNGTGRAIPGLDLTLMSVNGCDTSPMVAADDVNNVCYIVTADPKNASLCELLSRNIAVEYNHETAGIAGWIMPKDDVTNKLITGGTTYAEQIGSIIRSNTPDNIETALLTAGIQLTPLGVGTVVDIQSHTSGGFDYASTWILLDSGSLYRVDSQNENLVIYLMIDHDTISSPIMTAPDIVYTFDATTGMPITNADILVDQRIYMGLMPVDSKWWITGDANVFSYWQKYFVGIGYEGNFIKYQDVILRNHMLKGQIKYFKSHP